MAWTLYVDETGGFSPPESRTAVVGVLVPFHPGAQALQDLDRQLRDVYASLPWPPHATHLRRPIAHALASTLVEPERRGPEAELLDSLAGVLTQRDPEVLPSIARSNWANQGRLDARVRNERPALYRHLVQLRDQRDQQMRGVLRCLWASGAWALVAVPGPGDPSPLGSSDLPLRDAYLRGLLLLLEQARAFLLSRDGREHLHVCVATRNVPGRFGTVSLGHDHVRTLLQDAERAPWLPPGDPRFRTLSTSALPGTFTYRDDTTPAGLVVADYVANRVGSALKSSRTTKTLSQRLRQTLGLQFHRRPALSEAGEPLPVTATDGPARAAVHAAFRTQSATPCPPGLTGWAHDATRAWIAQGAQGWT